MPSPSTDKKSISVSPPQGIQLAFKIANQCALPAWVALCFLPSNEYTQLLVFGSLFVSAIVYIVSLLSGARIKGAGFTSLRGVMNIFQRGDAWVLNGCWTHYLCFDLAVGAMISRDALGTTIPYFLVIPCLLSTLLFGPSGFLIYSGLKYYYTQQFISL